MAESLLMRVGLYHSRGWLFKQILKIDVWKGVDTKAAPLYSNPFIKRYIPNDETLLASRKRFPPHQARH